MSDNKTEKVKQNHKREKIQTNDPRLVSAKSQQAPANARHARVRMTRRKNVRFLPTLALAKGALIQRKMINADARQVIVHARRLTVENK
jgi:hypothetical protein